MAHRVRTNRTNNNNQQKALAELQAHNFQLKGRVRFLKVAWRKTTLKDGKLYGPHLIDMGTSEEANTTVSEGLVHDHEPGNFRFFHSEYIMTQCYKC
jgi:hypothetical protein